MHAIIGTRQEGNMLCQGISTLINCERKTWDCLFYFNFLKDMKIQTLMASSNDQCLYIRIYVVCCVVAPWDEGLAVAAGLLVVVTWLRGLDWRSYKHSSTSPNGVGNSSRPLSVRYSNYNLLWCIALPLTTLYSPLSQYPSYSTNSVSRHLPPPLLRLFLFLFFKTFQMTSIFPILVYPPLILLVFALSSNLLVFL